MITLLLGGGMFLIMKYKLAETPEHIQIVINSDNPSLYCKKCGHRMHRHGSRLRKVLYFDEDGERKTISFRIQRFCCRNCHKTHDELPGCIIPYKRYSLAFFEQIFDKDNQYIGIGLEFSRAALAWLDKILQRVYQFTRAEQRKKVICYIRRRKKGWLEELIYYYYNLIFPPVFSR